MNNSDTTVVCKKTGCNKEAIHRYTESSIYEIGDWCDDHLKMRVNMDNTSEIQSLRAQLEKAEQVYERFRHLDVILSDKKWMDNDDKIHLVCYELWMTIKQITDKEKVNP